MTFKCQLNVLLSYGGQARDQEPAVQRTFHHERSSFFYLSSIMVCAKHRPLPSGSEAAPYEPWNAIMHRDWLSLSGLKCLRHPIINFTITLRIARCCTLTSAADFLLAGQGTQPIVLQLFPRYSVGVARVSYLKISP